MRHNSEFYMPVHFVKGRQTFHHGTSGAASGPEFYPPTLELFSGEVCTSVILVVKRSVCFCVNSIASHGLKSPRRRSTPRGGGTAAALVHNQPNDEFLVKYCPQGIPASLGHVWPAMNCSLYRVCRGESRSWSKRTPTPPGGDCNFEKVDAMFVSCNAVENKFV